jgi:hypothetical protein
VVLQGEEMKDEMDPSPDPDPDRDRDSRMTRMQIEALIVDAVGRIVIMN